MHSVIDTGLSPATRFDAETLPRTAGNLLWLAFICTKICIDIFFALKDIRPIASKWPMQEEQHHLLTKTDIVNTLPPHTGDLEPDNLCPFCRDQHTDPLDLPCSHIYCRACVETLVEYGHNKCGLCRQQYYLLNDVAPSIQLQQQATFAKRVLTTHLKYWALASVCLIAHVAYSGLLDSIDAMPRGYGAKAVFDATLVMTFLAYLSASEFVKRDLRHVEIWGEEWWTTMDWSELSQREERVLGLLLRCGMIMAVSTFQLTIWWLW